MFERNPIQVNDDGEYISIVVYAECRFGDFYKAIKVSTNVSKATVVYEVHHQDYVRGGTVSNFGVTTYLTLDGACSHYNDIGMLK